MKVGAVFLISSRLLFGRRGSGGGGAAGRSLRSAIIGIALSLLPLVVILELADGMIEGIMSRYVELENYHYSAEYPSALDLEEMEAAAARLRRQGGVDSAYVERRGAGVAMKGLLRNGVELRAIDPAMLSSDPAFRRLMRVEAGRLELPDRNSALVGSALAGKLGLEVGDSLSLLSLRGTGGGRTVPRLSNLRVTGIISSGYQEMDALWLLVPLELGYGILGPDSSRAFIGIKAEGGASSPEGWGEPPLQSELRRALGPGWMVEHWSSSLDSTYRSLLTMKSLLLFISAMILTVAAVNVSSAVLMMVIERRSDIAVLKGIGASQAGITLAFTAAGAFIGLVAVAAGMALGIFLAVNVNQGIALLDSTVNAILSLNARLLGVSAEPFRLLDPGLYLVDIPIRLDYRELTGAACLAVFLSAFAAWVPARRTRFIPPLELLRRA